MQKNGPVSNGPFYFAAGLSGDNSGKDHYQDNDEDDGSDADIHKDLLGDVC
jgi:hypothetical protein